MSDLEKVKEALLKEFDFVEKKVSAGWLDAVDITPDKGDPEHWETLLYSKEHNVYINLRFFPRMIDIEYAYSTDIMGRINYKKGMTPQDVVSYMHNILDKE